MLLPFNKAMTLLHNWRQEHSWMYVQANLEGTDKEYLFWGQLLRVSEKEICFAGDGIALPILLTNCTFEHIGANHIPQIILKRFKETDCCVFIRFGNGSVLLYGRETRVGFVNTFQPRAEIRA
ncbi:MAG TPA: hypothetical protein VI636_18760 [Candidatus Angelobacter sp.]